MLRLGTAQSFSEHSDWRMGSTRVLAAFWLRSWDERVWTRCDRFFLQTFINT
jgi:hypothetical protein